jgi:hypothetical protein
LTLVNVNQIEPRSVVVQAGAYAEHRFRSAGAGGKPIEINGPDFQVRLAPGAGAAIEIAMDLFARQPALAFPWER